jgi:hypothetical protein
MYACRVDLVTLIPLSFQKVFETLGFVVQQGATLSDTIPSASAEDVYFVFPSEANVSFLDTARDMFTEFHALVAAGNSPLPSSSFTPLQLPAALLFLYPTTTPRCPPLPSPHYNSPLPSSSFSPLPFL